MGWVGESSCEEAQWVLAPPGGTERVRQRAGLPGVGLTAAHREASTPCEMFPGHEALWGGEAIPGNPLQVRRGCSLSLDTRDI